jgi:hypothetical protein
MTFPRLPAKESPFLAATPLGTIVAAETSIGAEGANAIEILLQCGNANGEHDADSEVFPQATAVKLHLLNSTADAYTAATITGAASAFCSLATVVSNKIFQLLLNPGGYADFILTCSSVVTVTPVIEMPDGTLLSLRTGRPFTVGGATAEQMSWA